MAFGFRRNESVPAAVRRIVREQVDRALRALGSKARPSNKDIHTARKCFRQIRGVVKLVRPELGELCYHRENQAFREASLPLANIRDAGVLIDTFDAVLKRLPRNNGAKFRPMREFVRDRYAAAYEKLTHEAMTLDRVRANMAVARDRIDKWPLDHDGWAAIKAGLKQSYQRCERAMKRAHDECADELFHEWRKRTKDLRFQLEILAAAKPSRIRPLADQAHQLTDLLGEDHDLSVLASMISNETKDLLEEKAKKSLFDQLARGRARLRKKAMKLGEKILSRHDHLVREIHEYWKEWREPARR